jgi:limonene-1,2-epoxide hydrolase
LSASSTQVTGILDAMATLDIDAMLARFRERASAVKKRPLPPVAGEERQQFLQQAKFDYQDFAIIGDAEAAVEDGILTLRIDLRPPDQKS